jgi:hypothetical protein
LGGDDGEGRWAPALQKLQTTGAIAVPIRPLLKNHAFGPDEIRVLTTAFEDTLHTLRLTNRADPVTEIIAKKIIGTETSDNQIRKSNIRNWTIGLHTFATGSLPRSGLVQRALRNISSGSCGSLRLDVGGLDHLGTRRGRGARRASCNGAPPGSRLWLDFKRLFSAAPLHFLSDLRDDVWARGFL